VYPLKSSHFTANGSSSVKRLDIGTDMMRIITSTSDELYKAINVDDVERP